MYKLSSQYRHSYEFCDVLPSLLKNTIHLRLVKPRHNIIVLCLCTSGQTLGGRGECHATYSLCGR